MQVHRLTFDDHYRDSIVYRRDEQASSIEASDAISVKAIWRPPRVTFSWDPWSRRRPKGPRSDFPASFVGPLLFSARAADRLRDLLEPNGEFLELRCDEGNYVGFNVLTMVDALDWDRSRVSYFEDGQLMWIDEYVLSAAKIPEVAIFKMPPLPHARTFVTPPFVERVKQEKLIGFEFLPVTLS